MNNDPNPTKTRDAVVGTIVILALLMLVLLGLTDKPRVECGYDRWGPVYCD